MDFELFFLGTGAADSLLEKPAETFANKDKRRCSAALLNGHVLLDCGPHVLNSLNILKIKPENITDIVVTHFHSDHFCEETVKRIAEAAKGLTIWFREGVELPEMKNCNVKPMKLFEEYEAGGLKITGVPANHEGFSQHLSVEACGKRLFYGLDGAWFLNETVGFLKNKRYHVFVFDGTVGNYNGDYRMGEHNSIPMIRLMKESLVTLRAINQNTTIILSHLASMLHKSHEETCAIVKADGFLIAYDGMGIAVSK